MLLIALPTLVVAAGLATAPGMGASGNVTVSMDVPSSISLTNSCTSAAATTFGTLQPGAPALTATDSAACRIDFQSSNDSAMLRLGQRDGVGGAMQADGGWTNPSAASTERFHAVQAVTSLLRIGAGRNGTFFRTVDGGASWSHWGSIGGTWAWLHEVQPVPGDPTTCFTVGTNAFLARIDNCDVGTPSVTDLTSSLTTAGWPSTSTAFGVQVISATELLVVGAGGRVARSGNGGTSFDPVFQVAGASNLYSIDSIDGSTIYAGGTGTANIFVATGGGTTAGAWSPSNAGTAAINDIDVLDATTAYAAGAAGTMLRFDGTSWIPRHASGWSVEALAGVAAHPSAPDTVYVAGQRGQVLRSTDGGSSWSRMSIGVAEDMGAIDAYSPTDVIAAGNVRSVVRTTDGTTWTPSYGVAGIGDWEALATHPTNGQLALAVGSRGSVRRTTDGGQTWTTVTTPTQEALFGVSFGSGTTAWAVGDDGTILRSTDTGLAWSVQSTGRGMRLWSVAAGDAHRAWAVGDSGTILHTSDGGQTWSAQSSGTTTMLRGISAVDHETAVAVGRGTVRYLTGGGATWTAPASVPNGESLVGVSHGSRDVLYAATVYQYVWRSADGGATWSRFAASNHDHYAISAADADAAYLAGSWGKVTRIDGGGSSSSTSNVASNVFYRGIVATGRESVIAVGTHGIASTSQPSASGARVIADYGGASANWSGTGTSSMFGVCMQSAGPQTTPVWTVDSNASCTTSDSDPWNAVPTVATKVATTTTPGDLGRVDLVWGVRTRSDQAPGAYSATIVFEAVAPNVTS